jgi:hypothetical protein
MVVTKETEAIGPCNILAAMATQVAEGATRVVVEGVEVILIPSRGFDFMISVPG